jgi:hypothetical protein
VTPINDEPALGDRFRIKSDRRLTGRPYSPRSPVHRHSCLYVAGAGRSGRGGHCTRSGIYDPGVLFTSC